MFDFYEYFLIDGLYCLIGKVEVLYLYRIALTFIYNDDEFILSRNTK